MNVLELDLNLLRVFDAVVIERSVTAAAGRVFERRGRFKSLPPPVPIPPADVALHWHERFDGDPGNRWLRGQIVELFAA